MNENKWIPVSSGLYPEDGVAVQVTYLSYIDKRPFCDAFAFRRKGKWYWTLDEDAVIVTITAWKHNCEPYKE
jgi:hypothetical protein